MINYEYPPVGGGGGVLCRDLAEGMVERGHRVTVITSQFQDSPRSEEVNGVALHRVPVLMRRQQNVASMASMLSYVPMAVRLGGDILARDHYDLVNTYFAVPSGPAGCYLSWKFDVPDVLHILGGDIYDPSKSLSPHRIPVLRGTVGKMMQWADRVVAESSDVEGNARRYYGTGRHIDIIPLAVRPNPHVPVSRASLGLNEDRFTLITVGRLIRRKNLSALLEIFGNIHARIPCQLLIVGEGPERGVLEERVAALELGDSVRFMGRVNEQRKFELLAASDVYVSTALHEGFGIVFLEAMECGLPVVCYDRGGQTDYLRSGETGYVVAFSERETFENQCCFLYESKEVRIDMGRYNAAYVKNFYVDKFIQRHLDVFDQAISEHEPRTRARR